jgi:quercetin dioxygenase-like cupin family protein
MVAGQTHAVRPGEGRVADMGSVQMRVLAGGDPSAGNSFALSEFSGGPGPWTVPHHHVHTEESFFVLDGEFTFTVGDQVTEIGPGSYILIPRGAPHMIHAGAAGGRLLALMVPGALQGMFFELAEVPGGLTDPAVRAEISSRYDSLPG